MTQIKHSKIEADKRAALKALINLSVPTTVPSGPGSKTEWSKVGKAAIHKEHWWTLGSIDHCVKTTDKHFQLILF